MKKMTKMRENGHKYLKMMEYVKNDGNISNLWTYTKMVNILGHVRAYYGIFGHVRACKGMLGHIVACYGMLWHVRACQDMPGHVSAR